MNIEGTVMFLMSFMKSSGFSFAVNTLAGIRQNLLATHMGSSRGLEITCI